MSRLLMVPIIMGCALVGTVSMINAIKKVSTDRFDQRAEKKEENNK